MRPQITRAVIVGGIDLTGVGYDEGSPTTPVVVVNFSDFGCPYCASFSRETYPALAREFVQTGKVLFKYVPFAMGTFPNGKQAARASECAAEQGKFWPMHARLYAPGTRIDREQLLEHAADIGLDVDRFTRELDDGTCDAQVEQDLADARALGVYGRTPVLFVNGIPLTGEQSLGALRVLVDDELLPGALAGLAH